MLLYVAYIPTRVVHLVWYTTGRLSLCDPRAFVNPEHLCTQSICVPRAFVRVLTQSICEPRAFCVPRAFVRLLTQSICEPKTFVYPERLCVCLPRAFVYPEVCAFVNLAQYAFIAA